MCKSIKDHLEKAKHRNGEKYQLYTFGETQLFELLEKVAKEQRKICADKANEVYDDEIDMFKIDRQGIKNSPSPLICLEK